MTYTGRIRTISTYLILSFGILVWCYTWTGLSTLFFGLSVLISLFAPVQWWTGKQYDTLKATMKKIERDKEDIESIFDNQESYMWLIDLANQKMPVSKGVEAISGYPTNAFKYNLELWKSLTFPEDEEKVAIHYAKLLSGQASNCEWRIFHSSGEIRWVNVFGNAILDEAGEVVKLVGVVYDVTERKNMEEQIQWMAYHDTLTRLPNRDGFNKHLQQALSQRAHRNQELAVLFIDLDRFKLVNDTLGHCFGDQLLRSVSARLTDVIPQKDIVARQSGDEFLVLLKGVSLEQVKQIAENILNSFKEPLNVRGEEFYITPSIGISLCQTDEQTAETVIQQADTAMYAVKKSGKNNYQIYTFAEESILNRRIKLERGLKVALKNNELELYYQPKIEMKTRRIYAVEALIRWHHPECGFVSPMEFIPIAEETGMIVPIGDWVLNAACRQARTWQREGLKIKVAVNVSILQFEDPSFVEKVKKALTENELSADSLIMEITESVMQNTQHSAVILQELKSIGVSIAIDDFGTGYSSLSVLNNILIDLVKIDRSFIKDVANPQVAALVKTIMQMGKNMNFGIVAEGIETEEQAQFLMKNHCEFGQGYLYSRPLPVPEIEKLLKQRWIQPAR